MSLALVADQRCTDTKILACRGCLATLSTDVVLHDLNKNDYAQCFSDFIGFSVHQSDGYPQFVCSTCLFLLRKFVRFRRKCLTAMQTLQQLKLSGDTITTDSMKSIDRSHIKHNYLKKNIIQINVDEGNDIRNVFDVHIKIDNEDDDTSDDDDEVVKRKPKRPVQLKSEDGITGKASTIVKQEHRDSDDSVTLDNVHDFEDNRSTYVKQESVKRTKQEHDSDDSVTLNVESNLKPTCFIKQQKLTPKNKAVKTARDIKPKILKGKAKPRKEVIKDIEEVEISDEWRKIIEEIKEEVSSNKLIRRKLVSIADIPSILKKAKNFAMANNVEIKFLTKAEQKIEIEEKRNSEKFKRAQYKCDKCCKVFLNKVTIANHCLIHHSGGEFVCEICLYAFRTRHKYQTHFDSQHLRKMTCKECGQISRAWTNARQHYLWHQGNYTKISCEQCDSRFAQRKSYLKHVQLAHGGGVNGPQCLVCDRAFYSRKGLQLHVVKMHQDKPSCSSCSVVFASADALSAHVNAPQGCQQGRSCCPKCGNNFASESEMKAHYAEVHMQNYYKCEQCGKSFNDFNKYTKHLSNHMRYSSEVVGDCPKTRGEKKKFVCEVCGVEKGWLALLKEHQLLHTGETPYKCDYCQKKFRLKQTLQAHIATHTGEKKFKCKICQKAFRQQQHRTAHMVTHTKERPFPCSACPKTYTNATNLREHVNTAHLGLPPRKRVKKD